MPQFFILDIHGHQLLHHFLYEGQMSKFQAYELSLCHSAYTSGFEVA